MADHDASQITDVDHERELTQERADGERMREALFDIMELHSTRSYTIGGEVCGECGAHAPCATERRILELRRVPATPGGI